MSEEFSAHPLYYLLTALSASMALLLGWDLWETTTAAAFFFFGIAVVATLWFASALGTRVTLSATGMQLHRPLPRLRFPSERATATAEQPGISTIDYRQFYTVDQSGRLLSVLTILYYPKESDGLLDLTKVATMTLPLMRNQPQLRDRLEAAILP